jgi:uncharacterized protein YggE
MRQISKSITKAVVILGMTMLIAPMTAPAHANPPQPNSIIAQGNARFDENDPFNSLIIDMIRLVDSAKEAMKSNDPEVKRMAQETYNMGMQQLQSMMSMWMKKNPFRTTSPR